MTAVPIWPGVTEYLYQAASLALVVRLGTCIVPSGLRPRRSRFDWTPIAGMATDTGSDWCSAGPLAAAGPIFPAAERRGAGACCCASTATSDRHGAAGDQGDPREPRQPDPATAARRRLGSELAVSART